MENKILWIEDDYYSIRGLVNPLEKAGYIFDIAQTASEAYDKCLKWKIYKAIVVDLILPLKDDSDPPPEIVQSWENERYLGIGLLKWLKEKQKVNCPIIVLSVIDNPIQVFDLYSLGLTGSISKRGLLPSTLQEKFFEYLKN